jgi:hypothetical protein
VRVERFGSSDPIPSIATMSLYSLAKRDYGVAYAIVRNDGLRHVQTYLERPGTGSGRLMDRVCLWSVGDAAMVASSAIMAPDAPCDRTYLRRRNNPFGKEFPKVIHPSLRKWLYGPVTYK